MVSICVSAPPGTAVHHAVNGGYGLTDHLLATMLEQQAGIGHLPTRIARPGVTDLRPANPENVNDQSSPVKKVKFDVMTVDEFEKRRKARLKGA